MVIADTGFFVALGNRRDHWHPRAVSALDALEEPLITTWPVLTETCHLLVARVGSAALLSFVGSMRDDAFAIHDLAISDRARILALMESYQDLPMDLADASLVLLAEHLGHGRILSTDRRDFGSYRWKQREPFENLLDA